jgi:hypothetical protein
MRYLIVMLLLVLSACAMEETCEMTGPFTCTATLGEDLAVTIYTEEAIDFGELDVRGDCFDQVPYGPFSDEEKNSVCTGQILGEKVQLQMGFTYEVDGETRSERGILKTIRR